MSYVLPGTLREKEGSRPLEPGLALSVSLQSVFFVACLDRALNVHSIRCSIGQATVTF